MLLNLKHYLLLFFMLTNLYKGLLRLTLNCLVIALILGNKNLHNLYANKGNQNEYQHTKYYEH